ncbi:hypothetical protein [Dactylosporangium sp. NPDC051541]|uniref:hypothetical protein n=1 Tax=Dactylosporangium sp. NPDC051541 TaxID=3363977 RepID=UPI0037A51A05
MAERGFARVGRSSFSLGAIVSNSSSRAAYRTTVLFRLLDSAGAVIFAFDERTLPMVLPGARLPAGVAIDLPPDRVVPVAGVSVELGGTHWVDVEPDNRLFRRYDTLAEASDGGQLRLPADMGSQPCAGLSASAAALVYRDASGSVVGGEEVAYTGSYCAGSHFGDVLNALYVPLEADRARTLIAVYCDT